MADDQAAATAQAAANNAVADDQAAATAQTAANNAVADDQAAATAQTAANNAVADDQAAATAQAAATSDADSHSTLAGMDIFTGFTIGTDKIDLLSVSGGAVAQPTGLVRLANVTESDDLTSALTAAFSGTAANKAALVVIEGGTAKGTYLYVNDADTALSATADVFIQLVGVTPGAVGQLAVGDYFA
jgi:membrane protein involved in colicin uptake